MRSLASKRWPQTQGRISDSHVSVGESDGCRMYTPEIEYSYVVEGVSHRGTHIHYWQASASSRKWADRSIARYPTGACVPVFYDPQKPSEAVLVPGGGWSMLIIALGGASLLVLAVLILVHEK